MFSMNHVRTVKSEKRSWAFLLSGIIFSKIVKFVCSVLICFFLFYFFTCFVFNFSLFSLFFSTVNDRKANVKTDENSVGKRLSRTLENISSLITNLDDIEKDETKTAFEAAFARESFEDVLAREEALHRQREG